MPGRSDLRAARGRRLSLRSAVLGVALGCFATSAPADQLIGAGAVVSIGNGTVLLGCTDLFVAGTLNLEQGAYLDVRNVAVLPGGVLNAGSGSLVLSGTFSVDAAGQFNPQQGSVSQNASACGAAVSAPPATIPTLGAPVLLALSGLLLWLAHRRLRHPGAPVRR